MSPTVTASGLALSRGTLVFFLAVMIAVGFVVSAGTRSRLPLVLGTSAGAVSVYSSATVVNGVKVAVASLGNGEGSTQAQVGTGAVLALVLAVVTTIIAGGGLFAGIQERPPWLRARDDASVEVGLHGVRPAAARARAEAQ